MVHLSICKIFTIVMLWQNTFLTVALIHNLVVSIKRCYSRAGKIAVKKFFVAGVALKKTESRTAFRETLLKQGCWTIEERRAEESYVTESYLRYTLLESATQSCVTQVF